MIMGRFSRIAIPVFVALHCQSVHAAPLVARALQPVPTSGTGITMNAAGQFVNSSNQVVDQNGNRLLTPNGQPVTGSTLSTNQNGQLVTPSGQVLTVTPNGQFRTQTGQIVDQNGNPISGVGQPTNQAGLTMNSDGQLVAPNGQIVTVTNNGQLVNQLGQTVDPSGNPILGNGQLPSRNGVTMNQDGQLTTSDGQIVTVNNNGQLVNQAGQVVDPNGNPVNSGTVGDGLSDGSISGTGGDQGGVVNNGQGGITTSPVCPDPSVPMPEDDYGLTGECGTVRNPNQPGRNSVLPGENIDGTGTPNPDYLPGGRFFNGGSNSFIEPPSLPN